MRLSTVALFVLVAGCAHERSMTWEQAGAGRSQEGYVVAIDDEGLAITDVAAGGTVHWYPWAEDAEVWRDDRQVGRGAIEEGQRVLVSFEPRPGPDRAVEVDVQGPERGSPEGEPLPRLDTGELGFEWWEPDAP